jgi:hypothetical protein
MPISPHTVWLWIGGLAGAPHEADDGKPFVGVEMQQVLPVALGIGLRERVGQPVVARDQRGEQRAAVVQDARLVRARREQGAQAFDERAQRRVLQRKRTHRGLLE